MAQNYFRSSLPTESALIERIEDSRGPNSVLFGIASPGGLINSTTKQAQGARSFQKGSFTHQDHVFDRYEPQVNSPQLLRGDPNQLMNDNTNNPYADQLYLEGGWQRALSDEASDTGRMMLSTEFDAKRWGNYRVALLTEYDKSFTGSATYREMWVDPGTGLAAVNTIPENPANLVCRRTYLTEGDWAGYHIDGPGRNALFKNIHDPITGRTLSSDWIPSSGSSPREVYTTTKSYMAAAQARYFQGRLIIAGGARRDELDEYQQGRMRDSRGVWIEARAPDQTDPTQTATWASNVGTNKTLGVVYHATPWLSVFYNQADNISLPARGQTRLPDDGTPGVRIPLEPPKGKGQDVSLAIEMFGGKVQTRATYYTTSGEKQSTTSPGPLIDANRRVIDALQSAGRIGADEAATRLILGSHGLFDHKSEGLEFQTTVNVTRRFRMQGSYSYTKASQENQYIEWRAWHAQNVDFLSKVNTTGIVTSTGRTVAEEIVFYQTTENGLNEYIDSDGSL